MQYEIFFKGGYSVAVESGNMKAAITIARRKAVARGYVTPSLSKIILGNGTVVFYCGVMDEYRGEEYQSNNAVPQSV